MWKGKRVVVGEIGGRPGDWWGAGGPGVTHLHTKSCVALSDSTDVHQPCCCFGKMHCS